MTTETENQDEKPLDPAAEKLRRKLVLLLIFSMGFLILSVMTVFGVILYRTMGSPESVPAQSAGLIPITLPAGAEIVDTAIGEGQLLLTIRDGQTVRLLNVSAATGAILSEYQIEREPAAASE
ncbi:hypothetical protein [Fulvimarina sp. MAC3]|uniref:hypothetical protein n=1 Tax=Fulvimarina sp. MAC3 TaxID=3148887 RepID=UPI0031FCBFFF